MARDNRQRSQPQPVEISMGGGSNAQKEGGGATCPTDEVPVNTTQGSPSVILSPIVRPSRLLVPPVVTGRAVAPVEEADDLEVPPLALELAESPETWLETNTARMLEIGARRAATWKDPVFSTMFFGKLLDYQAVKAKATIAAKGSVIGAAIGASASQKAILAAAEVVDSMDPDEAMRRFRDLGGVGE